jgi:hypothetical protein
MKKRPITHEQLCPAVRACDGARKSKPAVRERQGSSSRISLLSRAWPSSCSACRSLRSPKPTRHGCGRNNAKSADEMLRNFGNGREIAQVRSS